MAKASEALFGPEHLELLTKHLQQLNQFHPHPNRKLYQDSVLITLLLGFYHPSVRSLRTLEDQSCGEDFQRYLPLPRVCRSTLSDALAHMEGKHLLPIVHALMKQVPALRRQDGDLHALLKRIIAGDGSVFTVPADVMWAIAQTRTNGQPGRKIRLNLQLDVLQWMPITFSVSGADDASESAAFIKDLVADVIYVHDRNFADFKFIRAVFAAGSDLVVRLKEHSPNFVPLRENPLTDADRQAHVISDRIGYVPGSAGAPGFGQRLLREVIVIDPRSGKPVRLLTSLLDLPARIIGLIYRHRWMIELFFKWLKCIARVRHLFSHSPNGIATEFYVAVIMVLLTYLRTGQRPSIYAFNCLGWVASGQMSAARAQEVLARRQRERDLERLRLAHKRAAKIAG